MAARGTALNLSNRIASVGAKYDSKIKFALRQDESLFQDGIRQKINGWRTVPSASRTPPAPDTAPPIPPYPIRGPLRYENFVARQPGSRRTCIIISWAYMRSSHGGVLTPWRSSYSTHVVKIHSRRNTFGQAAVGPRGLPCI